MSYEGYYQVICKNGHYFQRDAYDEDYAGKCPCGADQAWLNSVDDTNCHAVGVIPGPELEQLRLSAPQTHTCSCGHTHVTAEATYRVPSEEETHRLQHYWDGENYISLNRDTIPSVERS